MGKCTGLCSRLSLSYDVTLLAALRMTLSGETLEKKQFHCAVKGFRKRNAYIHSNELDYCADVSAILTHYKLLDDKVDERGAKKAKALVATPLFAGGYKRAKKRRPELDALVHSHMEKLTQIEAENLTSIDRPAACFGELLGEIAAYGLDDPACRIAKEFLSSIGKWVYRVDAADDYDEDKKKGRYNPFLSYEEGLDDAGKEALNEALTSYLADAERAFILIDDYPAPEFREILKNLLYAGLPSTAARVLAAVPDRKDHA